MSWNGESVKKLRQKLGYTQSEFAESLGCRQQTISEWEQGLYAPANAYGKLLSQIRIGSPIGEIKSQTSNSIVTTGAADFFLEPTLEPQENQYERPFDPAID